MKCLLNHKNSNLSFLQIEEDDQIKLIRIKFQVKFGLFTEEKICIGLISSFIQLILASKIFSFKFKLISPSLFPKSDFFSLIFFKFINSFNNSLEEELSDNELE